MTDTRASQNTPVFATAGGAALNVAQVAVYFLTTDAALGALVPQLVVYAATLEYEIPINYHGYRIGAIWGNPLYIQRGV